MARSILSLLTVSSILSSIFALPLENRNPRPNISIVNVDGSSDPTYIAPPQVVTQTIATTVVATVNVNHDTATETVWVTTTPTPTLPPMPKWTIPCNSSSSSTTSFSTSSIAWPTPCNTTSTTSSASSTSSIVWSTPCNTTSATTSSTPSTSATPTPCDDSEDVVGDGAPFHTRYPIPTSAWGTGIAHPIHPTGGLAPRPSGMTAPLPTLPPNETPYWFNQTQVPNYRKRIIINE